MSVKLTDVDYVLRKMADGHRVDLVNLDGSHVQRSVAGGIEFRLRSRPWIFRTTMKEQDLLLAGPADMFRTVCDQLAQGASELRGTIFRDLLLNMNDYPVDFLGDTTEPAQVDKILQDAENAATRLMKAVDTMRGAR